MYYAPTAGAGPWAFRTPALTFSHAMWPNLGNGMIRTTKSADNSVFVDQSVTSLSERYSPTFDPTPPEAD